MPAPLPAPPAPTPPAPAQQLRPTAIVASGFVSAFAVLWVLRGLPLGSVVMWLAPLPLYASAFAFGSVGAVLAAAAAALPMLVLGGVAAALSHGLSVGLPVAVAAWLALWRVPKAEAPRLGAPVAGLALMAGMLFAAAAFSLSDHPGGLYGALRTTFAEALGEAGHVPDELVGQVADMVARVVPMAIGLWFLGAMALNAVFAQRLVGRLGLLARPPVLFGAFSLPGWYAPLPVLCGLAALLLSDGARYVAAGLAEILLLPFFLLGLCVVHALARGTKSRRGWLVAFYFLLLLFSPPVLFATTFLGFADHFANLRGRIAARANSGTKAPPEDRT